MVPYITNEFINNHLNYPTLVEKIQSAFTKNYHVPNRQKMQYRGRDQSADNTLLFMPAWSDQENLGVKLITVTPSNSETSLPSIQGLYILFDTKNGKPELILDAKALTTKRTAASSALVSRYLSRTNAQTMLMVGTGALCKELIKAHSSVRPITKVMIWGRNFDKSQIIASSFVDMEVIPIKNIETGLETADIISCATLSSSPLILGKYLNAGQHLDLVGAYLPHSREADDEAIRRATIYIDTDHAKVECGEIRIPLENGVLKEDQIKNDLPGLCRSNTYQRVSDEEITLFKSTGHALEDLVAASLIKEIIENGNLQ